VTGSIVLATIAVAVYVALYVSAVPRAARRAPTYLREPPSDLPPALVGMLFDPAVTPEKMPATLLDLVRRGVITMSRPGPLTARDTRPGDDDRWLTVHRDRMTGLRRFESELVYEVFDHIGRGERVRTGDLREWWRTHPATGAVIEVIWGVRLQQAMLAEGLSDARALRTRWVLYYFSFAVMCGVVLGPVLGIWALLFFSLGSVLLLMTMRLTGVSRRGAELLDGYTAFRRYVHDYGRFGDQPAEAVAIWEDYLPLAVVLGLGGKSEAVLGVTPEWPASGGDNAPDRAEARAYLEFRLAHDPALPSLRAVTGLTPSLRSPGDVRTPALQARLAVSVRNKPLKAFLLMSPVILAPVAVVALALLLGGNS
jgi:hypothetical protein